MDLSAAVTPLQKAQAKMVRTCPGRLSAVLPESSFSLGNSEKVMQFFSDRAEIRVLFEGLWHLKITLPFEEKMTFSRQEEGILCTGEGAQEYFSFMTDPDTQESCFLRRKICRNDFSSPRSVSVSSYLVHYLDGPVTDFGHASCKLITRGGYLDRYLYPEFETPHLSYEANNQLFYNYSGNMYTGTAWLDVSGKWISRPGRDKDLQLCHTFLLPQELELAPGETREFSFLLFAGTGKEEHAGRLSDLLWRLNRAPIHLPQTDMRRFLDNYFSVWKNAELDGVRPADHYAAHFFVGFYGQFPDGYYPPDQFGCSWLSYDLLKADYFCRLYDRTKDKSCLEKARNLVNFYCCNHFIGSSHLTWPYHTGDFMKACPPYCKRSGWGAPLDAGYTDSLAQSEMVYDALLVYRRHPEFFPKDYPRLIAEDVLKMQQADGHFRRRYNDRLEPVEKPGWIDQNYESQSWIPSLLLLAELGAEKCFEAALRCGEAALFDLEIKGLFAMGGCETDYPTYWDIDGYRSMLRAMLALYDATGEQRFLDGAEKVQQFSNVMMCGYNVELPEGTFYHSINWRCKGMIATSFYSTPDYLRSFSTPTGNQSVCWVGYLLLQLFRATGKRIYADRGLAAIRQVMVYRNEESLKGKPYLKNLLYTIFENNPQMSDPGGGYEAGVAQDGYSMFIDLYIYLDDILQEFGDVYFNTDFKECIGINCYKVHAVDLEKQTVTLENEFSYKRNGVLLLSDGGRRTFSAPPAGETFVISISA